MAFIVPVVRKDYNLYPSVTQVYQRKHKAAAKDMRLTKSLPQFPISTSKSTTESCRYHSSQKFDASRANALPNSCTANEYCIKDANAFELQKRPASALKKKVVRRATYPPSYSDGPNLQTVRTKADSDCSSTALTEIQHSTNEPTPDVAAFAKNNLSSRSVGELWDIRVPSIDSGYSTSETASPASDSPPTTSSMSAPTSPNLQRSSLRRPKSSQMNVSGEENKENNSMTSDKDSIVTTAPNITPAEEHSPTLPSARHVHFGFCEQIEYECHIWENEPTKYSRLKRLEQRLAAQLKNTLLFRPRANSLPITSQPPLSPMRKNQDKVLNVAMKSDATPISKKLSVDEHLSAIATMPSSTVSSH